MFKARLDRIENRPDLIRHYCQEYFWWYKSDEYFYFWNGCNRLPSYMINSEDESLPEMVTGNRYTNNPKFAHLNPA